VARFQAWIDALTTHLRLHWQRHLLPAVLLLAMLVLFGWAMIALWVVIFGGTFALMGLGLETAGLICFFGVSALGSLFMVLFQIAGAVLMLGYARLALLLQLGHSTSPRDLLWGFQHPIRSVGFVLLVAMLVFASASLFYLPLVFIGGWLMLAVPSLVQGDRGLFGSLGRAWTLCGRAYGELLLMNLVLLMIWMMFGFFPIFGPVLVPITTVLAGTVTYDSLMRE
jgi:hypothetical protein